MSTTFYKNIHIGEVIHQRVTECEIKMPRICNFFKCDIETIEKMYEVKSLDTEKLLQWSKLLEYDFFRLYSQYLILYSPPKSVKYNTTQNTKKSLLPQFRKNIYTKEIIDFVLELIRTGKKSKKQVTDEYNIPKTTLYKWLDKY